MENKVIISGNITKSINFAMQQNYVPIIRNLVIHNDTEENLSDLELKITFGPEFAKDYSYHINEILSSQAVEISPVRIHLKTDFLFSLTEKMVGNISVKLLSGDVEIYSLDEEIELLAFDEWSGLLFMPEIITAFVTPNNPKIASVIQNASELLKKWTGSPSFTGYQTQNPNNVKLQMAAIYSALQMQNIVYNNPPASYEMIGQRVRLPHIVLEQKQGTCLDLAVLYTACLEYIGLNPLMIFIKGHAFGGCWLENETFAECAVDDVSSIEKRIVSGAQEILLVECTDFVDGKKIDFDVAVKHGKDHLNNLNNFQYVIDIKRSRSSGIRPMPLRLEQSLISNKVNDETVNNEEFNYQAPVQLDNSLLGKVVVNNSNTPITKQKIWERKLLDFTLRNALLNFRVTKNTLQLMTADLGELEDKMSDGKDFQIMRIPSEWNSSLRDAKIFQIENEKDLVQSIATEEFKNYRIRTFLDDFELEKSLKGLYRSAKTSMEENGTNTLFLALGFLRWFESDLSEKARYAPIVLIPVDIVRNVRNKGYIIRSRQEDTQINVTLLEFLRQDHGVDITGLDPLPEDEHGIDMPLVFNTIRQAIMSKNRWNIEEIAFVGLFSFGQFVMWNDIRNKSEELEKNKVVSSLIDGTMNWKTEGFAVNTDNLDNELSLENMAIPVSADSSQMLAIALASAGQSFVLHGPPGTGKSQTITNMIANALYQGKSVLFVAEKMAALNVVQKRLENIGLGPFCLELHSNKTNKTTVLGKLNGTLEVGKLKSPDEYQETVKKVHELRNKLNYIVEALHSKRKFGDSLYKAIELFEKNSTQKGKMIFDRQQLQNLDKNSISIWNDLVREYTVSASELGEYASHPFVEYKGTEYSIKLREQLTNDLNNLLQSYDNANLSLEAIFNWAGALEDKSKETIENLLQLVEVAQLQGISLSSVITSENFDGVVYLINQLIKTGKEYNQIYLNLQQQFEQSLFEYSVSEAKLQWKQADASWFLPKTLKQNKLLKELKIYAKNPSLVTKENIMSIYNQLEIMNAKKKIILESPAELINQLSGLFMGISTDWSSLELALDKTVKLRNILNKMSNVDVKSILNAVENVNSNMNLVNNKNIVESYIISLNLLKSSYSIDMNKQENSQNWFSDIHELLNRYGENVNQLRNIVAFNQIDAKLSLNGLEALSDCYKNGKAKADELLSAYVANLYYEIVFMIIDEDERLSDFHGKQYQDIINQYGEAIEKYQQLTIQELVGRLSAKLPTSGVASASSSEMGILKKSIKNNGRMMSLRKLFDLVPTLIRKLCPCMLMSPISVAQYISPSFQKFDLVIFDEASQLPTSEAVGAIARGENVVIVGDPKQLPPTSFFSSNRIDEENSEKEDLESLLDDCLAISMPQESLKWHYRSRHESLIAYSNVKYYDNKLYTFPSPNDLTSEVKIIYLDGFYDKGKTKHNKAEAEAIVNEIIRRLKDENLRNDSIGVVTFSSVQQNLIDDMLYEEFKKYPELEEFDRKSNEPIFIKNLENVQGDERDVILFSIGYGPSQDKTVSMNFGPLNRDGGWRRLNVAISRARKSMIVYSVLKPEQIDLARTRSEGVAGLKGFLEFAERGKNVLPQKADRSAKQEDYLVQQIADSIVQMGYEVRQNIGCSQFKMDIGIVDSTNPNTYLLGIQLDGENCKHASTARDRFVLQPGVLSGLGWSIMRIWTLDWLDDCESVKNEIKLNIEKAGLEKEKVKIVDKQIYANFEFEKEDVSDCEQTVLKPYFDVKINLQGSADEFYIPENFSKIIDVVSTILESEAPISKKLLMKKVLAAWGITRGGSRVESVFSRAMSNVDHATSNDQDAIFFWKNNQEADEYNIYRVDDSQGNKRSIDDISSQEILNAVKEVLCQQISLSESDLVRETSKKFGFSRIGSVIDNTIKYAICLGLNKKIITKLENGNIVLET